VQPSTFELAKREDFASLPIVPSDFIRKHGATYSGEQINANFVHVMVIAQYQGFMGLNSKGIA